METIRNLVKKFGISVVMAIHDINLVAKYSDTIAMIKDGSIYSFGGPNNLFTPESVREVY